MTIKNTNSLTLDTVLQLVAVYSESKELKYLRLGQFLMYKLEQYIDTCPEIYYEADPKIALTLFIKRYITND